MSSTTKLWRSIIFCVVENIFENTTKRDGCEHKMSISKRRGPYTNKRDPTYGAAKPSSMQGYTTTNEEEDRVFESARKKPERTKRPIPRRPTSNLARLTNASEDVLSYPATGLLINIKEGVGSSSESRDISRVLHWSDEEDGEPAEFGYALSPLDEARNKYGDIAAEKYAFQALICNSDG